MRLTTHILLLLLSAGGSYGQTGTLTYIDGRTERNVLMNISSIAEPEQKVFIKQEGKWLTLFPANLEELVLGADTFETVRLNGGPPALLKKAVIGPLRLYLSEESFMHSFLIRHHGSSPLDPLATNAERVYTKTDTNYGNLVPVLTWPDGTFLVVNPADKLTLNDRLSRFLEPYSETIPAPSNRSRRVPTEYFITLTHAYNKWATKREGADNTTLKDKF